MLEPELSGMNQYGSFSMAIVVHELVGSLGLPKIELEALPDSICLQHHCCRRLRSCLRDDPNLGKIGTFDGKA